MGWVGGCVQSLVRSFARGLQCSLAIYHIHLYRCRCALAHIIRLFSLSLSYIGECCMCVRNHTHTVSVCIVYYVENVCLEILMFYKKIVYIIHVLGWGEGI